MTNETLAKWVADSMKADGLTAEKLAAMSEADRVNLSLAYVESIGLKIRNMQTQLLTRREIVAPFAAVVRSLV
jgi:hypothetical protein